MPTDKSWPMIINQHMRNTKNVLQTLQILNFILETLMMATGATAAKYIHSLSLSKMIKRENSWTLGSPNVKRRL
jgi:hypothetical protein